ncbi:hypothetical protein [Halomonas sp. OfavH-34-E]|uniref:hypothetical protein n=1 Tax=Halomonas sp. OfavH-34-E TaxID=2954491 RepID=UPI0020970ED6|nr:hypothetical protein [Halomonas sp. OfavH-34-E]MCO7216844.1 hypothetical protein [Halomonas sp. OfavH-34-E]
MPTSPPTPNRPRLDPLDLLDVLREAVQDDNLGPEVADGLSALVETDGKDGGAAQAAAGSLKAALDWHRARGGRVFA